jgi:DNA-binding transcriptional LysR family regulator
MPAGAPDPAGELLLAHARTILLGVEHLRDDLGEYARGVRGLVRLSANASAVEQFLPEDIAVFVKHHPDIRIDLRQATSRSVARAVRDHMADLGSAVQVTKSRAWSPCRTGMNAWC